MAGYDAHCHLDQLADPASAVERARAVGVSGWCVAAGDPAAWEEVLRIGATTGGQVALGVHPWWVDEGWEAWLARLPGEVDAVGETGLDHARDVDRALQRASLRAHLQVARERDLPVVLHCVRAVPELLHVLKQDGVPRAGGLVHDWTGSAEQTAEVVALGLHVSVGPSIVRFRSAKQTAMLQAVDPARLLLETDAPHRPVAGGSGEPADLPLLAARVAELRGGTAESWLDATGANARGLLGASSARSGRW